jgi:hypothetical protein
MMKSYHEGTERKIINFLGQSSKLNQDNILQLSVQSENVSTENK